MAVKLELPERAVTQAGAPAAVWLEYVSPPSGDALFVDVTWVNKTATRLPEVPLLCLLFPMSVCGCVDRCSGLDKTPSQPARGADPLWRGPSA